LFSSVAAVDKSTLADDRAQSCTGGCSNASAARWSSAASGLGMC
jgi:hypothetical protein